MISIDNSNRSRRALVVVLLYNIHSYSRITATGVATIRFIYTHCFFSLPHFTFFHRPTWSRSGHGKQGIYQRLPELWPSVPIPEKYHCCITLDFCFYACVNSGLFACLGIFLIIPIQGIFRICEIASILTSLYPISQKVKHYPPP
jgi:hypothetical protein